MKHRLRYQHKQLCNPAASHWVSYPQGQQPELALQHHSWKTPKGALWRHFLPVVLIASIDFPLYLSNRLRVEYLLFPSFPLVICPKRSDIAMKCHLVRKFLCAAPDLPFNEREPGKRHQTDYSATDKWKVKHAQLLELQIFSEQTH